MEAMFRSVRALFMAAVFAVAGVGQAAEIAPPVRAEIDALITRLAASGCTFNRNGTWYSAADAKAHLLQKLAWLERRDLVQTTEQFIERAASASSQSGQPYHVRCEGAAPVESRVWLSAQLQSIRGGHAGRSPP